MNRKPGTTHHSNDTHPTATRSDVIVVGAGPTGLLLAGDLATAGLDVTLLERRGPQISNLTRALVVHARTLEQFDARGLADELIATGSPVRQLRLFGRATLDPAQLPSRFPFVLVTPQFEVERLLEQRARKAGVAFVHGSEVDGLEQDENGVLVRAHASDDPARRTSHRAAYLVGTDGVRSAVREALGLPFPGKAVVRSIVLADVRLDRAPETPFAADATADALSIIAPFGDGWYRVVGWNRHRQLPDSAPVGLEEVREFTRLVHGTDYGMREARWTSRFHSDERQVPHYRVGRAFLAGDAAHVHSPAGGMGMNTGLQDAANLSWKLAAVLQGHAPERLLDTYHDERHPVGRAVLRASGAIVRAALLHTPAQRALRGAIALLVGTVPALTRRGVRTVSGIGISYPAGPGAHPLAGKRAPDLRLAGGGRLYEALREGHFVLVAPARDAVDLGGRGDRVVRATWAGARGTMLLVRPDGYIAWATDESAPARRAEALRGALRDWTGPEGDTDAPSATR